MHIVSEHLALSSTNNTFVTLTFKLIPDCKIFVTLAVNIIGNARVHSLELELKITRMYLLRRIKILVFVFLNLHRKILMSK